jgi:hypothetical protein
MGAMFDAAIRVLVTIKFNGICAHIQSKGCFFVSDNTENESVLRSTT